MTAKKLVSLIVAAILLSLCLPGLGNTDPKAKPLFKKETYTYGAKFEPPKGKYIHGMGQFRKGNAEYLEMLGDESIYPVSSLCFIALGDQPRPWELCMRAVDAYFDTVKKLRIMPHLCLALRGLEDPDADPEKPYGIDKDIAEGKRYDQRIKDVANRIKRYGKPCFVRIGSECNGTWNGYHPYHYPKAFQKAVKIFREAGVENAAFIWCYMAAADDDFDTRNAKGEYKWFPGADVIDWFAFDTFSELDFSRSARPRNKEDRSRIDRTSAFLKMAEKYKKPVMMAETSMIRTPITSDPRTGDRIWKTWFEPYFEFIAKNKGIKAFYYINVDWSAFPAYQRKGWKDARIGNNPSLKKSYIAEIKKSCYLRRDEMSRLNGYEKYLSPQRSQ